MKFIFSILAFALICLTASAQNNTNQDTTGKRNQKQNTPAPAPASTKTATASPTTNKIAVSDPGMPPEKSTGTNKRSSSGKPTDRKKKAGTATGVTPK